MPVNNLEFGSTVSKWVKKSQQRMEAVFRESTQRVVSEAQRMIPVDTGFARASIRASKAQMPEINIASTRDPEASYAYDPNQIISVILSAEIGDHIFVGWTANYAIFLEYGHSSQAPAGFVRIAALQWRKIVGEVTTELRSRIT